MPFVRGFLRVVRRGRPDQGLPPGEVPVDPDYGLEIPGMPDQGLPGEDEGPVDPGFGYPLPPIVEHPIAPSWPGRPSHPIVRPPTFPVDPGYGLPSGPGIWPQPPHPDNGPPVGPPLLPTHPIYHPDKPQPQPPAGGTPTQPIYIPGKVWPPLPPSVTGTVIAFCWIVGVGYRWVVIDASASIEHPIVEPEPPPVATPKR